MEKIDWIIIIGVIVVLYFIYQNNKFEGFDTTNEAIQNVSSLYNNQNMTITNITSTGKITGKDFESDTGNFKTSLKATKTDSGDLAITGKLIVNGIDVMDALSKCTRIDKKYALQSSRGGVLSDQGNAIFKGINDLGADYYWEVLHLVELPFDVNGRLAVKKSLYGGGDKKGDSYPPISTNS